MRLKRSVRAGVIPRSASHVIADCEGELTGRLSVALTPWLAEPPGTSYGEVSPPQLSQEPLLAAVQPFRELEVDDAGIDAFLAAGFTRRNVLEVVLGVATKVMSNYTNHLVHTQLDPFMKGNEWTKPV